MCERVQWYDGIQRKRHKKAFFSYGCDIPKRTLNYGVMSLISKSLEKYRR